MMMMMMIVVLSLRHISAVVGRSGVFRWGADVSPTHTIAYNCTDILVEDLCVGETSDIVGVTSVGETSVYSVRLRCIQAMHPLVSSEHLQAPNVGADYDDDSPSARETRNGGTHARSAVRASIIIYTHILRVTADVRRQNDRRGAAV